MKQVIILRGLPGSGKSYYAEELISDMVAGEPSQYQLCSTDEYFVTERGYIFDKAKAAEFHSYNLTRFIQALAQQIPLVIVDNTNIQRWEFLPYTEAANALGYQVKEVIVGEIKDKGMQHLYAQRNNHHVPLKVIHKMAQLFEW